MSRAARSHATGGTSGSPPRAKIRLHFLPPYCPNVNRIERLWQDLHANVTRNHRHRTMRRLLAAVLRWLEDLFTAAAEYAYAA